MSWPMLMLFRAWMGANDAAMGMGLPLDPPPRRREGGGVDVVEQVPDGDVVHAQVELAGELVLDEFRVLGEKQHPLAGREPKRPGHERCLPHVTAGRSRRS